MPDCPTCEKTLDTERGVKMHHSQVHGESIAGEEVSCHWCGDTFKVPPSRVSSADKLFCPDKNCRGDWLSETNTGENHNRYNKKEYTCDYCGKNFKMIPSHRQGEHKFCDQECSAKWRSANWRGEDNPLYEGGSNEGFTNSEREQIFERDDYTCQDCGDDSGGNLNAHHIIPASEEPKKQHDISNGVTLCLECHADRHEEPVSSFILSQDLS